MRVMLINNTQSRATASGGAFRAARLPLLAS
jgi:hypothetical protein